jgi:hypothetical protein
VPDAPLVVIRRLGVDDHCGAAGAIDLTARPFTIF